MHPSDGEWLKKGCQHPLLALWSRTAQPPVNKEPGSPIGGQTREKRYNLDVLRVAALALLILSLTMGCAQAQRGAAGGHGFSGGSSAHSGFNGQHHFVGGVRGRGSFSSVNHRHHYGLYYPYYWPYDYPYDEGGDYERPYTEVVERQAAPPPAPEPPPPPPAKAQVIEIPIAASAAAAKPLPPAVFILENGERLETSRFVLTAHNLSVTVNRRQRTIPVEQLNLDATVAANQERGIDLRVPEDRNEISLSF